MVSALRARLRAGRPLRLSELALLLGCSSRTLARAVEDGSLVTYTPGRRARYVACDEAARYAQARGAL